MNQNKTVNHRGFSLIELLIVIACIGIIMAISYPHMRNALVDARQSGALQNLRGMVTAQHTYHLQYKRFATLTELDSFRTGFGTLSTGTLLKNNYTFQTVPASPSVTQLESSFTITGTTVLPDGTIYQYLTDQSGNITRTLP